MPTPDDVAAQAYTASYSGATVEVKTVPIGVAAAFVSIQPGQPTITITIPGTTVVITQPPEIIEVYPKRNDIAYQLWLRPKRKVMFDLLKELERQGGMG